MKTVAKLLFAVSVLSTPSAFARVTFGAIVGGNFTDWRESVSRNYSDGVGGVKTAQLDPSGRGGYQGGGQVRFDHEDWALEVDGLYTSRNLAWAGADDTDPTFRNQLDINLKQIEVPFIAYYKIPTPTADYRIGLGLYASYGLGRVGVKDRYATNPAASNDISGNYSWEVWGFNRLNFGGLIAFGTDFHLGSTSCIEVELRGATMFTDIKKSINPNFSGSRIGYANVDAYVGFIF